MAWIESHQQLRDHPKVSRLSRLLDVHRTSAVGLLHFLWWWALDHAEDGDLTDFDCLDLALAAGWEGDPDAFVKALQDCGPGDRAGFICREDDRLVLHDWDDYAGKLVDRRVKDRERKRLQREKSTPLPKDVRGTSDGSPGVQNLTQPNQTEGQDHSVADEQFDGEFWPTYPERHGKKLGKAAALAEWRKLTDEQRQRALVGARHLAASDQMPKDAERFLRRGKGGARPFDDWQEPAKPSSRDGPKGPTRPPDGDVDYRAGWDQETTA